MPNLAKQVESLINAFRDRDPCELANSEEWKQVRERVVDFATGLIAAGQETVANRVDREYQALREALRDAIATKSPQTIHDNYLTWEAITEFHATLKYLEHWMPQILAMSRNKSSGRSDTTKPERRREDPLAGAKVDEMDERVVNWDGYRIYVGRETLASKLFWTLYRNLNKPCRLHEIQEELEGWETSTELGCDETEVKQSRNRIAKTVTKLRTALREAGLEEFVSIVAEGGHANLSYTMFVRRWWG